MQNPRKQVSLKIPNFLGIVRFHYLEFGLSERKVESQDTDFKQCLRGFSTEMSYLPGIKRMKADIFNPG